MRFRPDRGPIASRMPSLFEYSRAHDEQRDSPCIRAPQEGSARARRPWGPKQQEPGERSSSATFRKVQKSTYNALGPARHIIQSKNQSGMYFRMRQSESHAEREDAVARPALDGSHQVPRGFFRLDHLDRALIGQIGAHLACARNRDRRWSPSRPGAQARPHRLEISDQRRFRCRVRDHPREAAISRHAGDPHDVTPALLDHPGQHCLDRMRHPHHVDFKNLPEVQRVELRHQRETRRPRRTRPAPRTAPPRMQAGPRRRTGFLAR